MSELTVLYSQMTTTVHTVHEFDREKMKSVFGKKKKCIGTIYHHCVPPILSYMPIWIFRIVKRWKVFHSVALHHSPHKLSSFLKSRNALLPWLTVAGKRPTDEIQWKTPSHSIRLSICKWKISLIRVFILCTANKSGELVRVPLYSWYHTSRQPPKLICDSQIVILIWGHVEVALRLVFARSRW